MEKLTNDKCVVVNGVITPCIALRQSTEAGVPQSTQRGIWLWQINQTNVYGAKSGHLARQGVLFNYCPFCGVKINKDFE